MLPLKKLEKRVKKWTSLPRNLQTKELRDENCEFFWEATNILEQAVSLSDQVGLYTYEATLNKMRSNLINAKQTIKCE